MPETLLLAAGFAEDFEREPARTYRLLDKPRHQLSAEERAQVRAFVTFGHSKADLSLMEALPNLGLICCYGSGYDGSTSAPPPLAALSSPTVPAPMQRASDFAMGLIIAGVRQILAADRFVREGALENREDGPGPRLERAQARHLRPRQYRRRDCRTRRALRDGDRLSRRRQRREGVAYAYHADLVSLAARADVLVVSVRADDGNRHSVDAGVLAALGLEGYLVNVARGLRGRPGRH